MKRADLEHIIRATANIADDDEVMVVGSQAILGAYPDAPSELLRSEDADVYPKNHPERADLVDGSIGELSPFHNTYGYYAHGVGPETATLPRGWRSRLIPVQNANTRGAVGLCLEPHDLVVSKYVAGREKDLEFARAVIRHGLVKGSTLLQRLERAPLDEDTRELVEARIRADLDRT